uniref:Uncharacterized protein n=1 Tax=Strombidium inclinatum TaxID=197538 RepID=A0A7S3IC07_9SPIT
MEKVQEFDQQLADQQVDRLRVVLEDLPYVVDSTVKLFIAGNSEERELAGRMGSWRSNNSDLQAGCSEVLDNVLDLRRVLESSNFEEVGQSVAEEDDDVLF